LSAGPPLLVVLVILSRVATAPSFALLYSGLEPSAAGEVVAALEARGVPYQVTGTAIEVDAAQRDALRMSLAGEGLPANGPQGYELLDQLSGFGTTSQMFDAAYWRAKEGEFRAQSSPRPASAPRASISPTRPPTRFNRRKEVTASVAIRPASGGWLRGTHRRCAISCASSVPGLASENVTIIDADSGRVVGADQEHDRPAPMQQAVRWNSVKASSESSQRGSVREMPSFR
jgi:flagellar M-ring protein FliF